MIPLDPEAFKKNLGPGYKVGYFGRAFKLGDRSKKYDLQCDDFQVRQLLFKA